MLMGLQPGDHISALLSSSNVARIEATVVGKVPRTDAVLLGWRTNEKRPAGASADGLKQARNRYGDSAWTLVANINDYAYFQGVGDHCEAERIVAPVATIAAKPEEQWRMFQNKRPGECPCGGTRGVCPYHP